jgi:hypothetical protein
MSKCACNNDQNSQTTDVVVPIQIVANEQPSASTQPVEKECSICLNSISEDEHKTSCNHFFHEKCIQEWYKRSAKQSCPMCRSNDNKNTKGNFLFEDPVLLELRQLIRSGQCWIANPGQQMSAIDRFARGQLSYAEMRAIAG